MNGATRFETKMKLDEDAPQDLVIEVMDGAGEQDLIEVALGEGAKSQVRGQEMYVWPVSKSLFCDLDGIGGEIDPEVIELGRGVCNVSSGTAEVEKSAGRMTFRPIQLAIECRSTEDVLDAIPKSRTI